MLKAVTWSSTSTAPLGFLLTAIIFFKAGQYSARVPTEPSPTPSSPAQSTISTTTPSKPKPTSLPGNDTMYGGKKSVGYFVNWGIYGRKYMPTYIPANDLTHILYAFANINPSSGTVSLSDVWADKDIHYPGDSWNTPAGENHLFGNFKAIYLLKKKHRHLKLLLSIGGWTYSPSIHPVVLDPAKRAEFVKSSVALLDDYGLDGLDVDYEYPQNAEQARGYVDLLRELREALDQRERENGEGCKFLLTIAAPCGPDNYKKLLVAEMDQYLDFWNLMAYDYSGSWDRTANHQANLLGPPINTHEALEFYVSGGVASHKLVMGIPLYGRSFTQTDGPGHAFVGIGEGTWERGVYDYRTLPLPLDTTFTYNDEDLGASWTYDKTTREMISFDTPEIARLKGQFIRDNGLGGSMFWELSGDKMPGETEEERRNRDERDGKMREGGNMGVGKQVIPGESLVRVVKEAMTGHGSRSLEGMDTTPNWLHYPRSQFDNLRQGMPDA
ncbi:chitinase [Coprinopsis cinerea okayama7|uniref:chitinase n=1 Tax=Coprinopsis cinerea (strain Okayama-7 / 130 / ATCC MYA-4618 / FGSC 9003) TaxID=240176 RepID=A8PFV8_COPC7|nr:chitinase [Coprinopsis cinerea okayama7\|eukprot:XP_001841026.2 chitinase [Coprinopsis cinerea okayama7\